MRGYVDQKNIRKAEKLIISMRNYGIKPDSEIYQILMSKYVADGNVRKCGDLLSTTKTEGCSSSRGNLCYGCSCCDVHNDIMLVLVWV